MFNKFKKKKKTNHSIYLTYDEFRKLAKERKIQKNEQFLINYYKQLSNQRGVNEKEASHALNCIVFNDADAKAKELHKANMEKMDLSKSVDITEEKYLNKFIEYVSDKNEIKFVFSKVVTSTNSPKTKNLDINSIGTFIYELIIDFLKNKCLCKRHQIPSYNLLLSFINSIKDQLSYFNDNRNIFTLRFLIQYLPIIVVKFSKNRDEIQNENKMDEMNDLMNRMLNIDQTVKDYQNDICDIIDDLKLRTGKLKSNTYPEQIDELNNILNDLRKQIEILAEDLTKVENEQLSAERSAEQLRTQTLQKFGLIDEEFNINQHIQNVMDQNIDNILSPNRNNNNDQSRRGSYSKSQTMSVSQSQSRSHTINSEMASTSIRKPFFVRPLGFDVELDVDKNELFVSDVTLNSQAYKLKVVRGWRVVMVGREDRVSIMYKILNDANQQTNETNDDDSCLPLFITFQVNSLNL